MCAVWFMWAIEMLLIIIAWLISINWIQDLGWHVESRSKYLNFLLLYACELFYLLSYECMQQQSLDCYSFFRLIDGNCSHRSLHHIYPVGTVLLHFFNFLWSSSSQSCCIFSIFLIFCGHPVAFIVFSLGGTRTNQFIVYCYWFSHK